MKRKEVVGAWCVLFALGLLVAMTGCTGGDGDDEPAPADITGQWTGAMRQGNITVPMTMTMTQTGDNVNITWSGEYPDGPLHGTFAGTYADGRFTATEGAATMVLHFSGNTATGTLTDEGGTAHIQLTKAG